MSSFFDQVRDASIHLETRDQIVDYFKQQYPGQKIQKNGKVIEDWKGKLVDALSPIATDKDGNLLKRASLARRFQQRGSKSWEDTVPSKKQEEEYKALGEMLPVKAPPGGYHVEGTIFVKYSEDCVEREIDITITGEDADYLAATSSVQAIINVYNEQGASDSDGYGECGEPKVTVTPLG